jgi:glycosyltransferase involved in cell wall biosynthesis
LKVSVVIPVYNSSESLLLISDEFDLIQKSHKFDFFELIFVNDFSPRPEVWITLTQLCKKYSWVKAITFTKNFGQQAATFCGLSHASGDIIFTMDDDMQHHPKFIENFLEKLDHDVVIGRIEDRQSHFIDKVTTSIKSYFDEIVLGKPRTISLSSFRMIKREIVDEMLRIKNVKPFIIASIFHITNDVVNVSFKHEKRIEGKSNYSFSKRLRLFTLIIIDNSSILIRILRYIALYTFLFSSIYITFLFFRKFFFGTGILGWTSIISTILLLGSLNLLGISILGEYLSRIFPIIENKQAFVVKKKINFNN